MDPRTRRDGAGDLGRLGAAWEGGTPRVLNPIPVAQGREESTAPGSRPWQRPSPQHWGRLPPAVRGQPGLRNRKHLGTHLTLPLLALLSPGSFLVGATGITITTNRRDGSESYGTQGEG